MGNYYSYDNKFATFNIWINSINSKFFNNIFVTFQNKKIIICAHAQNKI